MRATGIIDDCGDYVVVRNATKVKVTGKKSQQKLYRHHTMFPGGLKEIPYKTMLDKKPEEVKRFTFIVCVHMGIWKFRKEEMLFFSFDLSENSSTLTR